MSFFNWFSGKIRQIPPAGGAEATRAGKKPGISLSRRVMTEPAAREDERKVKRQMRREQMYVAIRDAMTRAGVLSASYRFKVLSLDKGGNGFLVMMDLDKIAGDLAPQPGAIEALIVQGARQRFDITVPAVYWRIHELAMAGKPVPQPAATPATPASGRQLDAPGPRHEPIQAEEMAAFQQALLAASARSPVAVAGTGVEVRSGPRLPTPPVADFEDTEVTKSAFSPMLSNTQFGEPN